MSSGNTKTLHTDTLLPGTPQPAVLEKADFWDIWTQNHSFLLALCTRWVNGNEVEAREVLSGAMMRALDHLAKEDRRIHNPQAWLARILRSHCIDQFRNQARHPDLPIDLEFILQAIDQRELGSSLSPEKSMMEDEGYDRLKAAVEALPDRLRSVLILRAYQEMPYKEIAKHLDISAANARKRVQEARGKVRESLNANAESDSHRLRSVDPSSNSPRSERKAAEDELIRIPTSIFRMEPIAHPVLVELDSHRKVELPIATVQRPIRIQQKLESASRYILRHPRGWTRRQERARLLALDGKIFEAIEELNLVLERQPQRVDTLLIAARWLQWTTRTQEACELLEKGLSLIPDNAWKYLLEGRLHALQENFERANQSYEQACLKAPRPVCQLFLSENLMVMEDWDKAKIHLEKNNMRQSRLLYQACLEKTGHPNERKRVILAAKGTFHNDPYLHALNLEVNMKEGLVTGEAARLIRSELNELRRLAPNSSFSLFAKIAFAYYRKQYARGLELLIDAYQTLPFTLQHLLLSEKWFFLLGEDDFGNRAKALRMELFPNLRTWKDQLHYLPFYS